MCVYVCVWDYVLKNEVLVTYKASKDWNSKIFKSMPNFTFKQIK